MIAVEESSEAYAVRGAALEICFRRLSDRWHHIISIPGTAESFPLLASDEGHPDAEIPPSPVFQDLRLERLSENVLEFQLLGQAGKGIYSTAVRFDEASQFIDFDVCARGRSAASPLCTASRYTPTDALEICHLSRDGALAIEVPHLQVSLELSPVAVPEHPAVRCALVGEPAAARVVVGHVRPSGTRVAGEAGSARWRYRINLAKRLEISQ
jgi:hypothetical protein